MLKISGGRPPLVPLPTEDTAEEPIAPVPDEMSEEDYTASPSNLLPQAMVVYMGSDKGPFECGNCCYFTDNGECQKVQGPIDPHGCCNLYCPPNHDQESPEEGSPEHEMAESPEEEATEQLNPAEDEEDAGPAY